MSAQDARFARESLSSRAIGGRDRRADAIETSSCSQRSVCFAAGSSDPKLDTVLEIREVKTFEPPAIKNKMGAVDFAIGQN